MEVTRVERHAQCCHRCTERGFVGLSGHRVGVGCHKRSLNNQAGETATNAKDHQRLSADLVHDERTCDDLSASFRSLDLLQLTCQISKNSHSDPSALELELLLSVVAENTIE